MGQITLFLNKSNKSQFCEWLTNYCKEMRKNGAEYPYDGGGTYNVDYPFNVYQVNKIEFSARIKSPPGPGDPPPGVDQWSIEDDEEGVTNTFWEWVIKDIAKLSWLEVGERLKVTVSDVQSKVFIPPLFQLLWAIKADFPETSDVILSFIVEKADWWNISSPVSLESNAAIANIIAFQAREEIKKPLISPNKDDIQ